MKAMGKGSRSAGWTAQVCAIEYHHMQLPGLSPMQHTPATHFPPPLWATAHKVYGSSLTNNSRTATNTPLPLWRGLYFTTTSRFRSHYTGKRIVSTLASCFMRDEGAIIYFIFLPMSYTVPFHSSWLQKCRPFSRKRLGCHMT
jgi:hypothetical protein